MTVAVRITILKKKLVKGNVIKIGKQLNGFLDRFILFLKILKLIVLTAEELLVDLAFSFNFRSAI